MGSSGWGGKTKMNDILRDNAVAASTEERCCPQTFRGHKPIHAVNIKDMKRFYHFDDGSV